MSDRMVIGLCGAAGVGKSTVARSIQTQGQEQLKQVMVGSFAGTLRGGLAVMGVTKQSNPALYRELAQRVGTDIIRKNDPEHWIGIMHRAIAEYPDAHVIIDDVRFPNEVEMVRDMGGVVLKLVRSGAESIGEEFANHESERAIDEIDVDLCINYQGDADWTARDILRSQGYTMPVPRERIYIAGPYSDGGKITDPDKLKEQQSLSRAAGAHLLERGHDVHLPLDATAQLHALSPQSHARWLQHDLMLIEKWATAVFRVPGASGGADIEVLRAGELEIPVIYDYDEVADRRPEMDSLIRKAVSA